MSVLGATEKAFRGAVKPVARFINSASGGRITANHITLIALIMHVPIALLIANGNLLWAALLLVIFGLFDTLDGELARLQNRSSSVGALYDTVSDRAKETLLYGGIAYYLAAQPATTNWAFVPVLACGLSIMVSFTKAKGEAALALKGKFNDHSVMNHHFSGDGIMPYQVRITVIILGLLTNRLLIATTVIAVLAAYTVLERLRAVTRQL